MQQRLRRNATDIQAYAPEVRVFLDEDDIETEVGCTERRRIAPGARSDYDQLRSVRGVVLRSRTRRRLDLFRGHALRADRPVFTGLLCFDRLACFGCLDRGDDVTCRDGVTDRNIDRDNLAGMRRRHIHRCLVRLQRDEAVFHGNLVTGSHEHLDDLDIGEIAEVRHLESDSLRHYGIACNKRSTSASASPRNVVKRTAIAPSMTR